MESKPDFSRVSKWKKLQNYKRTHNKVMGYNYKNMEKIQMG